MSKEYAVTIGNQKADPYRILRAYNVTDHAQGHAIKKLLRAGKSHKPYLQDITEARDTLNRLIEMRKEDGNMEEEIDGLNNWVKLAHEVFGESKPMTPEMRETADALLEEELQ